MRLRPLLASAAAVASVGTGLAAVPSSAGPTPAAQPLLSSYIVTLTPGLVPSSIAKTAAQLVGGTVGHVYTDALQGFSITVPTALEPVLRTVPGVARIERDQVVRATGGVQRNPPSWGLDRIDQRTGLNGTYNWPRTGSNVTAYVIDTGIRTTHADFRGRAVSGFDAIDGGVADDCNGHGTHVAGTLGGNAYGVAKGVKLVAVRVLDCDGAGSTSQVVAGVDYVTRNHLPGRPAVANMSLGAGASASLDQAVGNAIRDGVVFTAAAGNESTPVDPGLLGLFPSGGPSDACKSSPGRVSGVITTGAVDRNTRRATYSDVGRCLDVFAPGSGIVSAGLASRTAATTLSGTSMAAPHVAGVVALILQRAPKLSVAQVNARIAAVATPNVVTDPGPGSPNRMLFVNAAS